ncbi:MAG: cell wall hydrolase [Lachnospiraceae bacterium]|nr:cell wall hydrolase [Lachnospiraceae bacterium]
MKEKRALWKKFIWHSVLMIFLALTAIEVPANATSDTKEKMEEAKKRKEEKEEELKGAQDDLARTQENLQGLQRVKQGYQGEMAVLNEELQEVADSLAVIETKIDIKQLEIDETTAELIETEALRDEQYEAMKQRICFMYETGGSKAYLEILLSAEDFAEFLNYADYIEELSAYDRHMLEEYIATGERIAEEKVELEAEMADLQVLEADAVAQQQQVNELIDKTARNIAMTADSIEAVNDMADAYEEEIAQREAEVAAADAEYKAIKAQYEEELRKSQLAAQSVWRDISQVQFEEGDRYLLANLIYCEAGAEPYEGKVAVGAVVINRVLSSVFPDTVTGVIYQRKQFSPTMNGRLASALAMDKATDACYRAADEAMSGTTNVGTRVFFRTPIPGLEGLRIGGHIFY